MHYRELGCMGWQVSAVSFGSWAIGGTWGMSMRQFALRWILLFDAVRCAIPGVKRPSQVEENSTAADLAPLSGKTMAQVRSIYDRHVRELVHHYW